MREGNDFTGVYQSVHMGRGRDSVDLWTHVPRERGLFLVPCSLGVRYLWSHVPSGGGIGGKVSGGRVFGGRVSGG